MAGSDGGGLRYYAALVPIVTSAVTAVAAYRAGERVAGAAPPRARRWFGRWCRATCRRLGVSLRSSGALDPAPCIYVSNHRSYLDIVTLGAVLSSAYLSRADVAGWRVVGTAARAIGTVFIDRDDARSRASAARSIARALRSQSLVVFPEGTTGGGRLPQPFAPGVFRLLERFQVPVVPVTVRYSDRRAYWVDPLAIGDHLRQRVLSAPLTAAVHVGARLPPAAYADADALAAAVYTAVCRPIEECGELVEC